MIKGKTTLIKIILIQNSQAATSIASNNGFNTQSIINNNDFQTFENINASQPLQVNNPNIQANIE